MSLCLASAAAEGLLMAGPVVERVRHIAECRRAVNLGTTVMTTGERRRLDCSCASAQLTAVPPAPFAR
jgi:hypothetical protein